jgi:hypothetical protein
MHLFVSFLCVFSAFWSGWFLHKALMGKVYADLCAEYFRRGLYLGRMAKPNMELVKNGRRDSD